MKNNYVDTEFRGENFSEGLPAGEYDSCSFVQCSLAGADLSHLVFTDCEFSECDLSLAKTLSTAFRNVRFKDCKLLGLHFNNCNPFLLELYFDSCVLNLSSFYRCSLKKAQFAGCQLREVDFSEAVLPGSVFTGADLSGAVFGQTNLEECDFRKAVHYRIDLERNKVRGARFSADGLAGLLEKYRLRIDA